MRAAAPMGGECLKPTVGWSYPLREGVELKDTGIRLTVKNREP